MKKERDEMFFYIFIFAPVVLCTNGPFRITKKPSRPVRGFQSPDLKPSNSLSRAAIRSSFSLSAGPAGPPRAVLRVSTSAESWAILSLCAVMVRVCSSRRVLMSRR